MGAGASDLAGVEPGGKVARAGLGDLPELCAAEVLLRLGAPDICRLARLNREFHGAAAADFVWEARLPGNYGRLLRFVDDAEEGGSGNGRDWSAVGKKDVLRDSLSLCRLMVGKGNSGWRRVKVGFAWRCRQKRWS